MKVIGKALLFNQLFWRKFVLLPGGLLVLLCITVLFSGCGRMGVSVRIPSEKDALGECVVLVHGMGRTLYSMDDMQDRLTIEGYHTVNLGYPSTDKDIEQIARDDFPPALARCLAFQPSQVHFVSHSLGGIVLRSALKAHKPEKMGRVVMLSPPSKGSVAADILKDWWFYKWLNGPAGQQLTTGEASYPNQLGPVDYPVGVITGDRYSFFDFWLSQLIPGHDDGKVSVRNARLDGMSDFLVVHEAHSFIMDAEYVQDETCYFLKNGIFNHQKPPLPPVTGSDWFTFPSK